jgi:2',3'-cyclic-nucleotide 2'-phosphodiesterase (5'-nucleotidase family)
MAWSGSTPVVQSWSSGRAVGVIDLPLTAGLMARAEVRNVYADSVQGAPPAVDSIVRAARARSAAVADRVVATLAVDAPRTGAEYALGRLVVDAFRAIARADVAMTNTGGVRAPLKAGPVTYGQLYQVQPFANRLVRMRLRGRDLVQLMESAVSARGASAFVSGVQVVWDSLAAQAPRVRSVTLASGAPVRPSTVYSVIVNDFMLGDDIPVAIQRAAVSVELLPLTDLAAFERYLAMQRGPIVPPSSPRIVELRAVVTRGGVQ